MGLFLGDQSGEEVLLPNKYCPEEYTLDELIKVFVYLDSEERKIATTQIPKIAFNEFASLQVTSLTSIGAFMDWGLEKDLFVPFREQRNKFEEGKFYVVYLDLDKETNRLFASNKIEKHLQNMVLKVDEGDEVDILPFKKTEFGISVIINNEHRGLVYRDQVFSTVQIGKKIKGYIKEIREGNKIDVSLQPIGYTNFIDPNVQIILDRLNENDGFLEVTDKSPPEVIYAMFGISKKAYKKAVGALYKQHQISILPNDIRLK